MPYTRAMSVPHPLDVAVYRESFKARERQRLEEREEVRRELLKRARTAIRRVAPEHPAVRRVALFGSILKHGRFGAYSDVDVAVDCADIEAESPFARELYDAIGRFVDLRPWTGPVARAVEEEEGEVVYEREDPAP